MGSAWSRSDPSSPRRTLGSRARSVEREGQVASREASELLDLHYGTIYRSAWK